MKKIMNHVEDMVLEMCAGIVMSNPSLELLPKYKVIKKKSIDQNKVTLISGGGSGHEPAHAGYIGSGMLDVAVCGDVFASPSQIQVYKAITETASNKGTLLIIKNYSGDLMNFQNAAYLAELDGLQVDYIKVNDDIAVEDSLYTVGRRGVAGTVLVHKLAGAAAQAGLSLEQVKQVAQDAADHVRSLGLAFNSCTVPAKGTPTFSLAEDEMEFGVGIHGEPGIQREKIANAKTLAHRMVTDLMADFNQKQQGSKEFCVLINGFGATPLKELYILCYNVMEALQQQQVKVYRVFVGNYMTSIDMQGASVSLMALNEDRKKWLDATCDAPAFSVFHQGEFAKFISVDSTVEQSEQKHTVHAIGSVERLTRHHLQDLVYLMGDIIIENEVPFCELDAHAGDGDFGMSVSKGFHQLQKEWSRITKETQTMEEFLHECAMIIMEYCGGASGPIWGFAFKYAAVSVRGKTTIDLKDISTLFEAAVQGIQDVGKRSFGRGAEVGDKTLIDALIPLTNSLKQSAQQGIPLGQASVLAAKAAREGAKSTEKIVARMGRAGTVGERSLGYPDAGAHAIGVIFTQLAEMFEQ